MPSALQIALYLEAGDAGPTPGDLCRLAALARRVLLITPRPLDHLDLGVVSLAPLFCPAGPLAAAHAGLTLGGDEHLLLLPGGGPGLELPPLQALLDVPAGADLVRGAGLLPARFSPRCRRPLERALRRDPTTTELPRGLKARYLSGRGAEQDPPGLLGSGQ